MFFTLVMDGSEWSATCPTLSSRKQLPALAIGWESAWSTNNSGEESPCPH